MKKILFVCHGNICRSPMAEFIFRKMVADSGKEAFYKIASAAVSSEETGNDLYPPAKRILRVKGIPFTHHAARQMTAADYQYYDYIICMDQSNLRWLDYIIGSDDDNKVTLLMSWAHLNRNVADPWYTGDFETAYDDIEKGCQALFQQIENDI